MSWRRARLTAEGWLLGALFIFSVLCVGLMGWLVAEPKALFGRALSAIAPSLFPTLVLLALAGLCAGVMVARRNVLLVRVGTAGPVNIRPAMMLFGVLLFYALLMVPIGFLCSSALSLALISLIAGNRSPLQIGLVSLISPVALYLVATRGLAVSLPELSSIEFFYAWVLDR